MIEQRWGPRASRTLAVVLTASVLAAACGGGAPAASPSPEPPTTTLAPALPPETIPTFAPMSTPPPAEAAAPAASPAAATDAPAAQASASPSPSAEDEARKAKEDQLRKDLAAAKTQAEALAARMATECPDLKPGELRHPGAVGRCAQLKREATQAAEHYEALKQDARAQGIAVQ
jgi:hypothetical protein